MMGLIRRAENAGQEERSARLTSQFWWGLFAGFVVCGVVFFGSSNAREKKLTISIPNGPSMMVEAKGNEIDPKELLKQMYAEDFVKAGLVNWLVAKGYYHVSDARLSKALKMDLCDAIPQQPLSERIARATACADKEVASELRQMAQRRDVPFHYTGKVVTIGVPAVRRNVPPSGRANTCKEDDDLAGKRIELTNLVNQRQIEVLATGYYTCTGMTGTVDIQLSPSDARKLFDGPRRKYQEAIAVVLN